MNVMETRLPGVLIVEPKVFGDERGFFMETWNAERYEEAGLRAAAGFVQDNLSFSRQGVLRGLHFQNPDQQGKLVYVLQGEVYDFLVTSSTALFAYKCTAKYNARAEAAVLWNDPEIGIRWPVDAPTLSEKDRAAPALAEMPVERLPSYGPS